MLAGGIATKPAGHSLSFLLDADSIISFLNGRPEAVELVEHLANQGLAVSAIAYGEIYSGIKPGEPPARVN